MESLTGLTHDLRIEAPHELSKEWHQWLCVLKHNLPQRNEYNWSVSWTELVVYYSAPDRDFLRSVFENNKCGFVSVLTLLNNVTSKTATLNKHFLVQIGAPRES